MSAQKIDKKIVKYRVVKPTDQAAMHKIHRRPAG